MSSAPILPEGGYMIFNEEKTYNRNNAVWLQCVAIIARKLIAENDELSDLIRRVQLARERDSAVT